MTDRAATFQFKSADVMTFVMVWRKIVSGFFAISASLFEACNFDLLFNASNFHLPQLIQVAQTPAGTPAVRSRNSRLVHNQAICVLNNSFGIHFSNSDVMAAPTEGQMMEDMNIGVMERKTGCSRARALHVLQVSTPSAIADYLLVYNRRLPGDNLLTPLLPASRPGTGTRDHRCSQLPNLRCEARSTRILCTLHPNRD